MSGLEVVGAVASVAQLAGVVYSISKQLYEVGNALSNAPDDIRDLAHDLEVFSEELILHSTLVNESNSIFSDHVNRLTAKIIGRCATICVKIDKILRKLRTGTVWAKLKWLYKEKEIMKLLARLRDLKLSLMGTLSLLRSMKADHMMDAMGIPNPSLLAGQEGNKLSKKTVHDIEETRRKLEGISVDQRCDAGSLTNTPHVVGMMSDMNHDHSRDTIFLQTNSVQIESPLASSTKIADNALPFIYTTTSPGPSSFFQTSQAIESVESFQSAVSHQDDTPDATSARRSLGVGRLNSNTDNSSFYDSFSEGQASAYPNYTIATPQLPLLRIPEDNWNPGLSYANHDCDYCGKLFRREYNSRLIYKSILVDPSLKDPTQSLNRPQQTSFASCMIPATLTSSQPLPLQIISEPDTMQQPPALTFQQMMTAQQNGMPAAHLQAEGLSDAPAQPIKYPRVALQQPQMMLGKHTMMRAQTPPEVMREVMYSLTGQTTVSNSSSARSMAVSNLSLSAEQREQLWWRAFEIFRSERTSRNVSHVEKAWTTAISRTKSLNELCQDENVAAEYATKLLEVLQNIKRIGAQTNHIEFEIILPITSKVQDILEVMQKNLEFKTGSFAWVGICQAISSTLASGTPNKLSLNILATLADYATLIARYNVMESMYHQWPGMTLDPDYEQALLGLCVSVLEYIEMVLSSQNSASISVENLRAQKGVIAHADDNCRSFKVTILEERYVEDLSLLGEDCDEDWSSDDTLEASAGPKRGIEKISQ